MISPTDRIALHAASLEFLKSQEGLVYLQELYKTVELPPTALFDMRNEYLRSFQNAEVCVANLWMINSGVTSGGEFSGAALLICGSQGTEQSEEYVEHICQRMSKEDWQGVSRLSVATIKRELAKEDYEWGNCRTLPLDFTDNYPVHLFDTIVGRDSIYLTDVPCLVNTRSKAKAFAIPRVVMERCGVAMPCPSLDEMMPSFLTSFMKDHVPGLYEEDLVRAVGTLTLSDPNEAAKVLMSFYQGMSARMELALDPVEFQVMPFRDGDQVASIFVCPEPAKEGEVYFSAAVIGQVGDGSEDAFSRANFTYYLLEKAGDSTRVLKRVNDHYEVVSEGVVPDIGEFFGWVHGAMGGDHRVRQTASDDDAMAAAIQTARETVVAEIEPFLAGQRADFMIKVAITDAHEQTEHMWLDGVSFAEGAFAGHITEAPHTLEGFQEGQRFRVPPEGISDWMYLSEGRMFGNYTLRAMLPSMPEAEASKYLAILAD